MRSRFWNSSAPFGIKERDMFPKGRSTHCKSSSNTEMSKHAAPMLPDITLGLSTLKRSSFISFSRHFPPLALTVISSSPLHSRFFIPLLSPLQFLTLIVHPCVEKKPLSFYTLALSDFSFSQTPAVYLQPVSLPSMRAFPSLPVTLRSPPSRYRKLTMAAWGQRTTSSPFHCQLSLVLSPRQQSLHVRNPPKPSRPLHC